MAPIHGKIRPCFLAGAGFSFGAMLKECPETMRPHAEKVLRGEYDPGTRVDDSGVKTVLDIGANVGAFSLWAESRWPEATITAYEPWKENADMFDRNLGWKCNRSAVSLSPQPRMKGGRNNCGEARISLEGGRRVKAIDPEKLPSADFIKLDTEGCETQIIYGLAQAGTLRQAKIVAFEYHRADDRDYCYTVLTGAGFELVRSTPSSNDIGVEIWGKPELIVQPKKVFVALPVYGGYDPHFTECLLKLTNEPPLPITVRALKGDSLVARARNSLAAEFMSSDCTHLLFIDTDLIFSPQHVTMLAARNKPLVCGMYPKKQRELAWVINGYGERVKPDKTGLLSIRYGGTGFMLIERGLIQEMIQAHPGIRFTPDHRAVDEHDLFSCGVYEYEDGKRRYLSEDWFFCQRALDLGYHVYADTRVILKHVGECIYPIDSPFVDKPTKKK